MLKFMVTLFVKLPSMTPETDEQAVSGTWTFNCPQSWFSPTPDSHSPMHDGLSPVEKNDFIVDH